MLEIPLVHIKFLIWKKCLFRAEFEAAVDKASEDETPSIMDEDEWTDRNFGNSLLLDELPNTSEDSVTDLDSEEELTDNER